MVGQRAPALRMVRECAVCESECSLVVSSAHVLEHSGAVQRPEPEVPYLYADDGSRVDGRLYPPAWGLSRQAIGPDRIGGYHLPAGWLMFIIPFVMHRLPAYSDEPEKFFPERFTPARNAARAKFVYLPFGAGPRQCIGSQFAMVEAQLVLGTLAGRYRLRRAPGHPVEPWPLITLRPRYGIQMTIELRIV